MRSLRPVLIALPFGLLLQPHARPASAPDEAREAARRDDTLAHIEQLPASNPYRAALLRYQTLSPADREYLAAWSLYESPEGEPPRALDARRRQIARELSAALLAASSRPDTTASDWPPLASPTAPDDPAQITIPGASAVRHMAWISVKHAASLPPAEAASLYAAVAQLGRRQRSGATLGEQLAGAGIEASAQTEIARRLTEFSEADLARLHDSWTRLQAVPATTELLEREIDFVLRPTIALHLAPGLRELVAQADMADQAATTSSAPDAGFTRDLRLSALLHITADDHRIVLEDIGRRETFSLQAGQSVRGIELVSLDYDKRLAVIRRGEREAVVHLESKRFVERNRAQAGSRDGFHSRQDQKLLARIRAHPDGVDGFVREVLVANEQFLRRQHELAGLADCPPPAPPGDGADWTGRIANPGFGHTLRTLNRYSIQATMLQAAIRLRQNELQPDRTRPAPADPWAAEASAPFSTERAPDGGFVLRSRYELRPGQPVTFKFAAPDAGFVRVSTP